MSQGGKLVGRRRVRLRPLASLPGGDCGGLTQQRTHGTPRPAPVHFFRIHTKQEGEAAENGNHYFSLQLVVNSTRSHKKNEEPPQKLKI